MKVSERLAEMRKQERGEVDSPLLQAYDTLGKENYEFPISVEPVHDMNNVPIENYRLIRRVDTDQILTINSERYSVKTHKEVVDIAENALTEFEELQHAEIETHLIRNGARMIRAYKFNQIKIAVDDGEPIAMQLRLNNSYDRTARIGMILGAYRGHRTYFVGGKTFDSYIKKHYESVTLTDMKAQIQGAIMNWTLLEKTWTDWKAEKIPVGAGETLIKRVKLPEKYTERILERVNLTAELTKWKLYDISCVVIEEFKKSEERAENLGASLVRVFYK